MLSKFSKWLIYAASYSPAYIILAIRLLLSPQEETESLLQKISLNYTLNTPAIITLSVLFLLSVPVLQKIRKLNANERICVKIIKNCTGEMASFFIPFIFSLLTIGIDWYGWLISLLIYLFAGFIVLQADWIHLCPVFFYLRYRLYQAEDGSYVLSRLNAEQFNQLLLDSTNGIEARALIPKLYIVTQKHFQL